MGAGKHQEAPGFARGRASSSAGNYLDRVTTHPSRVRQRLDSLFGIDPRALAALRIAMGVLVLVDLLTRLPYLTLLYTDNGLLPRWLAVGVNPLSGWSLHTLATSPAATLSLFGLAGASAGMLLVGFHTRLASVASWALLGSLQLRNPYILDGGDYVLRVLLFWSMFVPLDRCWAVNARRPDAPSSSRTLLSAGTAAILLQVGFIYFFAGAEKMLGSEWRDGTAVHLVASHQYWARPLGTWIASWPGGLLRGITYGVLGLELLGSLLLFAPIWTTQCRMLAVSLFLLFHLATGLSIELGLFPFISSAGLLLFVPSRWWDRVASLRLPSRPDSPPRGDPAPPHQWGGWVVNGVITIALTYTIIANVEVLRPHWIFSDRTRRTAALLGVGQGWGMYAPSPYNEGFRLEIRATRADGAVQVLDGGGAGPAWAPLARMRDGYRAKIYLEWIATGGWPAAAHHFASWVCRNEGGAASARQPLWLVSVVKLVGDSPAIPTTATRETTLARLVCAGSDITVPR